VLLEKCATGSGGGEAAMSEGGDSGSVAGPSEVDLSVSVGPHPSIGVGGWEEMKMRKWRGGAGAEALCPGAHPSTPRSGRLFPAFRPAHNGVRLSCPQQ